MAKKPVLLCIMDGFGWVPNETYGNAVAEDTGVRGAAIDLYMNSYQECKQFGRQKNSTVYFLD